jgi:hypothetical protein
MTSVLATTGELARVAGPGLRVHIGEVLPLIIEAIQDTSGGNKRLVAVSTLGQVRNAAASCTASAQSLPILLQTAKTDGALQQGTKFTVA